MATLFPKKAPGETVLLTFDFTKELPDGVTLSNPAVSCLSVTKGAGQTTDISLTGSAAINGLAVSILCAQGLTANTYRMRAEADASNGEHRFIDKDLPVDDKGALV